jgi:ABC-type Fe3+/spermidine/putrescine transport system ATPase subunit
VTCAIELDHVRLRLGATTALDGLSLRVAAGELLALLGPSGSGKTSAIRAILGFLAPDAGVIKLGERVASEPRRVVIPPEQRGVGAVFQDLALWPHLTVHGNLAFGFAPLPRDTRDARIAAILDRVGLASKAHRHPGELSGGERQRVAIARALVLEPRVVALDEPLANLDVALKQDLLDLFAALLHERGAAAIYVTHDPWEAEMLADLVAVIDAGRLLQVGTITDLRERPAAPLVNQLLSPRRRPYNR